MRGARAPEQGVQPCMFSVVFPELPLYNCWRKKSIPPDPLNSFSVALSVQTRVLATGACVHHMHLSVGAAPAPTMAVLVRWQQVSSGDSTNKGLCDPGRSGQGDSKLDPPRLSLGPDFAMRVKNNIIRWTQ